MEQQYQRLSTSTPDDVEAANNLEKEDAELDSDPPAEPCAGCRRVQHTAKSGLRRKPRWQICFTLTFWLLASTVLAIWIWRKFRPQSVVPGIITEQKLSRLFMPDERFNPGYWTEDSDEAWAQMHSRFVMIEDPDRYRLPLSLAGQTQGSQVYAVAAFHQLHCLRIVRGAWYAVIRDGVEILNGPVDLPGHPAYKNLTGHVAHCFDYIRQSLMCSGDASLEAFLESDGVTLRPQGSSGWGVEHQCVDFDAFIRWTEEHKDPGP